MRALTRHFFQEFFRLSFLEDAGEESFRRVIIGVLAAFIAIGLWLPRIMAVKYGSGFPNGEEYLQVVMADRLLMVCLPMFIVAFAMALVVHSLFPDELDYRILMALPVERATIFAGKLAALFLYASLFIVTTNVAFGVPFSLVSMSPWATHYWPVRAASQIATGVLASAFATAVVISIQGLVIVLSPRMWLRNMAVATQTALVCALVILFPLGLRWAAAFDPLAPTPAVLMFVPPVWFLGLQEVLLGNLDRRYLRLAAFAVAGTALVSVFTASCYAIVYHRFDQVIVRSQSSTRARAAFKTRTARFRGRPEHVAVTDFATATLRRSALHQLVFLGIAAAGLSLATSSLFGARSHQARIGAAQWGPFVLMFAAVLGLHAALLLPVTRRAAWVFRLTEEDARRPHQIAAAERVLLTYGVLAPMVAILPALLLILGVRGTVVSVPVMLAMGAAFAEMRLWRWHRIPFTCSYLPGKRPVAHTLLLLLASFTAFTGLGSALVAHAMKIQSPPVAAVVILLTIAGGARWLRLDTGANRPLEFEDELPESSYGLRLNN
jgi:hypothetical protein